MLKCVRGQGPYVFTALPSVSLKFSVPDFQSALSVESVWSVCVFHIIDFVYHFWVSEIMCNFRVMLFRKYVTHGIFKVGHVILRLINE